MLKLTQYADDTTIVLDGTTSSLQATLNILEIYGSLSGLNVNCDKTKLIWIGSKKDSKEKLNVTSKLHWGDSQCTLLGLEISTNLSNIPQINYSKAILKAKRVLNSWRFRYLTPFGKITILKTLILSQFNHLFTSVVIEKKILVDINKIFYEYLWNGKPDKISRNDVCRSYHAGGLKMINVYNFEKCLKLSWLKYISNETKPWIQLLKHTVGNLSRIPIVGGDWHCCTRKELNPFWKTVFEYWSQFCVSQHVKTNEDIMSSSIWFNPNISKHNLFFPDWCQNGIYVIADIIDEEGNVCSLDKLRRRYGFHINFLNYIPR